MEDLTLFASRSHRGSDRGRLPTDCVPDLDLGEVARVPGPPRELRVAGQGAMAPLGARPYGYLRASASSLVPVRMWFPAMSKQGDPHVNTLGQAWCGRLAQVKSQRR
jgi:hypothetical protein